MRVVEWGTLRHVRAEMRNVRAIMIHEYGEPAQVARVETLSVADPRSDEALIEMLAAPINPADLNVIEGSYPIRPELPGVPGVEGVGRVVKVGAAVSGFREGDIVLAPHGFGSWREAGV